MHRIVLVTYPGFELLDVSGPASVFNGANRALARRNKPAVYEIRLISATGGTVTSSSGVAVETMAVSDLLPADVDTLLIAGAEREPLLEAVRNEALRPRCPGSFRRRSAMARSAPGALSLLRLASSTANGLPLTGTPASR